MDIDRKPAFKGSFHSLNKKEQEIIMEIASYFHFRNGVLHCDGSRGETSITPGELNDILSYTFILGEESEKQLEQNGNRKGIF
jgi:hypothetical protein